MKPSVREVKSAHDLHTFIRLPYKLHKDHQRWVPPLYSEEKKFFNPAKNIACSYSDTTLALARENGRPVGRIMGIINHRYNDARSEKQARFACLECPNDESTAQILLSYVEEWARANKMDRIIGPMGFTDQDPQGFLIDGFDGEPSIGTYYNFAFIPELVEKLGYEKEMDYAVYRVDLRGAVPRFYQRIAEWAAEKNICQIINLTRRKHIKAYILPVLKLMNQCFEELYGYHTLDETEMIALAKRFLLVLDPKLIKIAVSGEDVVGFNIAMPNLAQGFRRAKGRLFPFGGFRIMRAAKQTQQLDSLVGGIRSDFRGRGIDAMIGCATMAEAISAGYQFVDSHHELEDNYKVRREMEKLGGKVYKWFRIYRKFL